MNDTLPSQKSSSFRGMADLASEIVVAGIRFSKKADAYLVNGIVVAEAAWQQRLRGARELHQAISEIYDQYPV